MNPVRLKIIVIAVFLSVTPFIKGCDGKNISMGFPFPVIGMDFDYGFNFPHYQILDFTFGGVIPVPLLALILNIVVLVMTAIRITSQEPFKKSFLILANAVAINSLLSWCAAVSVIFSLSATNIIAILGLWARYPAAIIAWGNLEMGIIAMEINARIFFIVSSLIIAGFLYIFLNRKMPDA